MVIGPIRNSGLQKISSLRLVFLLSSDDPGPWDPREPVAVEPSPCPRMFQDLAEPEPLDGRCIRFQCGNRGCKAAKDCSIFVTFASYEATVLESVWTQFANLGFHCMSSGTLAILHEYFIDFLLHRAGAADRSLKVRSKMVRRTNI